MLTASESGSTNDMFCLRYISKIYNSLTLRQYIFDI